MFIICLFGFYRNADKKGYNFNIKSYDIKKYIYIPELRNEDKNENNPDHLISKDYLLTRFGNNTEIELYKYNKQIHLDKCNLEGINIRFNQFFQQPYRIFSFFYNVRGCLKMLNDSDINDDNVIILSRIDIGLTLKRNINVIQEHLKENDVLLGYNSGSTGTEDKWFIFKNKRTLECFINLYDDYGTYINQYLNKKEGDKVFEDYPETTRPEDIFPYHFKKYNLKYKFTKRELLECHFKHVCSPYCGHHKGRTKT